MRLIVALLLTLSLVGCYSPAPPPDPIWVGVTKLVNENLELQRKQDKLCEKMLKNGIKDVPYCKHK